MTAKRQTPKITIDFWEDGANSGAASENIAATTNSDKLCVNTLKLKFKKPKRKASYGSMLWDAVMSDKPDDVQRIITEEGIKINEINKSGVPLIHEAAFEGRIECVKALLDCGATVNTLDAEDWTALHAAVLGGHIELVRFLIQKGADLYAETNEKYIPFHIAIEKGDEDMIALLVEKMSQLSVYGGKDRVSTNAPYTGDVSK